MQQKKEKGKKSPFETGRTSILVSSSVWKTWLSLRSDGALIRSRLATLPLSREDLASVGRLRLPLVKLQRPPKKLREPQRPSPSSPYCVPCALNQPKNLNTTASQQQRIRQFFFFSTLATSPPYSDVQVILQIHGSKQRGNEPGYRQSTLYVKGKKTCHRPQISYDLRPITYRLVLLGYIFSNMSTCYFFHTSIFFYTSGLWVLCNTERKGHKLLLLLLPLCCLVKEV